MKNNKIHKTSIGGQAVIEGVMMRGSKSLATAVRTPKGNIEIDCKDNTPITYSNFKIVDKNDNVVLNGDTDSVTLENGDKYIRFN